MKPAIVALLGVSMTARPVEGLRMKRRLSPAEDTAKQSRDYLLLAALFGVTAIVSLYNTLAVDGSDRVLPLLATVGFCTCVVICLWLSRRLARRAAGLTNTPEQPRSHT